LADCRTRGITADDLVSACETYAANKSRFSGPGAIAAWVRNGDWPVDGVMPPEQAKVRLIRTERNRQDEDLERWAHQVITAGKRAGQSREAIASVLAKRGYVWC
jgi:hypothetical protein